MSKLITERKWKPNPVLTDCKTILVKCLDDFGEHKKGSIAKYKYKAKLEKGLLEYTKNIASKKEDEKIDLEFLDKNGKRIEINLNDLNNYDYNSQISNINKNKKKSKQKVINSSDSEKAKYLLQQEKPIFQSLGIGIHNEVFYFGTKVYDGTFGIDAIITDDKKIHLSYEDNNQIRQFGINYRYPFLDSVLDYSWSNNSSPYSISEYLYGEEKEVTLKECFEDTYSNFKEYMDYHDEMIYISKACDVLSSFFLPCFEAKGRTFDNAEKGSGKTKSAMLYDLQMFNPIMSADMSGSSYFRIIEATGASIIVDDFDSVEEDKKLTQIQIIRTGYKKGQKAVRVGDDKNRTPSPFSIFNSMLVNNVGGLDDITQDRCNTYYLIKSNNPTKVNKKLNEKDPRWTIERDKKYYCALKTWRLVKDTYEFLRIDGIDGRDWERVAPILSIGKLVLDNQTYNQLVKYELERIEETKVRDVSDDWLFQALKYVVEKYCESNKGSSLNGLELRLDQIVKDIINMDESDKDYQKKKHSISVYLGKCFKNTPLFKLGKVHGGYVKCIFKAEGLLKFLEIRGYTEYIPSNLLSTLKQSIQPIQPNLSIQPIQPIQKYKDNGEIGEYGEVGEGVVVKSKKETSDPEIDEDYMK